MTIPVGCAVEFPQNGPPSASGDIDGNIQRLRSPIGIRIVGHQADQIVPARPEAVRVSMNVDKFEIRKAVQSDLPVLVDFLARLALHVAGEPPHALKKEERKRLMAALRSSLSDPGKLLVVAEASKGRLVGMGYLHVWTDKAIWERAGDVELKTGIIDDVWVEPDFRKLGVFSAILGELVAFAESHDIDELILEYAVSNKEAAATWIRLGFKPTGIRAAAFTTNVKDALAKRQ